MALVKEASGNKLGDDETVDSFLKRKQKEWFATRKDSIENSERYWSEQAENLTWTKKWNKVCDTADSPITKWFSGGELNMCYNLLDRHIESGNSDEEIFIFHSIVTNTRKTFTLAQIYSEVTHLSGVLSEYSVKKGDPIFIYMPMMPETAFAMLATNRLGALQCVMPSGLPAQDLATRIDHAKPKVIITASHGYHDKGFVNYKSIIDEACSIAKHKIEKVLVLRRTEVNGNINMIDGRDEDWDTKVKEAQPFMSCITTEATEPFFAIYTSGSTGEPKAIVHSTGGYATNLVRDANRLFTGEDEVLFGTSNFAWIAGQMIQIHVPLLMKQKVVLLEGDPLLTSDPNALYRLIEDNKITRAFVRPGILKYLRSEDPNGEIAARYNLNSYSICFIFNEKFSLMQVMAGGETLDTTTIEWTIRAFGVPIMNVYAQTEIATTIAGNIEYELEKGRDNKVVIASIAFPGLDVAIVKEDQSEAKTGETGRILIRLPLPPAGLATLWNDHERCKKTYFSEFPGYYDTKDDGYITEEGHLRICSRADDVMKHANIYLAAQAVENVVLSHPDVIECLVISVPHPVLKELPVTVYVARKGTNKTSGELSEEIITRVSSHFGKAVTFGKAIQVKELPRTRTGKLHRSIVTALGRGDKLKSTGAVENPEVLLDIDNALKKAGYATKEV